MYRVARNPAAGARGPAGAAYKEEEEEESLVRRPVPIPWNEGPRDKGTLE